MSRQLFARELWVEEAWRVVLPTKYVSYEVYEDRNRTSSRNFDTKQNDREYSVYASIAITRFIRILSGKNNTLV
jgi:hypothetical protein